MCTLTSTLWSSAICLTRWVTELVRLRTTDAMLTPCSTMTAVAGGDVDALADAGAGQQAGDAGLLVDLGHADDAVALEGGIAREVGNAVIGHTKRSWNGTRHEVSSR